MYEFSNIDYTESGWMTTILAELLNDICSSDDFSAAVGCLGHGEPFYLFPRNGHGSYHSSPDQFTARTSSQADY